MIDGEAATAQNRNADGVEEVRTDAIPGCPALIVRPGRGMALHEDAVAPVVPFKRAVHRQGYVGQTGQVGKTIFNLPVESGKSVHRVSRTGGINVKYITVGSLDAEILMLCGPLIP
jgi:hypothetical protein